MKKLNVVLMVFVAAVAMAPAAQGALDPMTFGFIVDTGARDGSPGRWADERGPGYLTESATVTRDGDGSMMIDYSLQPLTDPPWTTTYDRVPRAYFEPGAFAPSLGDLTGKQFTFSWRKGNDDGTGPEHLRQMIIYSPNGLARFTVANGETSYIGWQDIVTAAVGGAGWDYEGTFDAAAVTTIDFWVSSWGYVGPWGEPGSYQVMPTGTPVYIDSLQLTPEPATMALLGLGGLALLRRRKA
jgi:hypothetical protein